MGQLISTALLVLLVLSYLYVGKRKKEWKYYLPWALILLRGILL